MKTTVTLLAVAACSWLATPGLAIAQPPSRTRGGPGAGGPPGPLRMLQRLDDNEDGQLSKDEVPDTLWTRLSRADTNDDGVVSKGELSEIAKRRLGARRAGRRGPEAAARPRRKEAKEDPVERSARDAKFVKRAERPDRGRRPGRRPKAVKEDKKQDKEPKEAKAGQRRAAAKRAWAAHARRMRGPSMRHGKHMGPWWGPPAGPRGAAKGCPLCRQHRRMVLQAVRRLHWHQAGPVWPHPWMRGPGRNQGKGPLVGKGPGPRMDRRRFDGPFAQVAGPPWAKRKAGQGKGPKEAQMDRAPHSRRFRDAGPPRGREFAPGRRGPKDPRSAGASRVPGDSGPPALRRERPPRRGPRERDDRKDR